MRVLSFRCLAVLVALLCGTPAWAQCRADFDASGSLDSHDFAAFQQAFVVGDSRADVTRDGQLDLFDCIEFQNLFAAGCAPITADSSFGVLYNGLGANLSFLLEQPARPSFDFGPASDQFVWLTQGTLKIRAARTYADGSGTSGKFWIDFGYEGSTGGKVGDIEPVGDTAQWGWVYNESSSQAIENWISDVESVIGAIIDDYEDEFGAGSSDDLKIMLDNETVLDRGGKVGMGLQTNPWTESAFWAFEDQYGVSFIERYSELSTGDVSESPGALPQFIDNMVTQFSNVDFGWYHIPHAAKLCCKDCELLEYQAGSPPTCSAMDADAFADGRDAQSGALLELSQFIDGHSYVDPLKRTKEQEAAYHPANLDRIASLAASIERPVVATKWVGSRNALAGIIGDIDLHERFESFFDACVDNEIDQAAVLDGWREFVLLAAARGVDPGRYWRDVILSAAVDAGFVDPGSNPDSELTLVAVSPDFAERGETAYLVLHGSAFTGATSVSISGNGITVQDVSVSGYTLVAEIDVDAGADLTSRSVTVDNGTASAVLQAAFEVVSSPPAPVVDTISPDMAELGYTTVVAIKGEHFQDGAAVTLSSPTGITVTTTFVSSDLLVAAIAVGQGASLGEHVLTVTNPDSQHADGAVPLIVY